MAYIELIALHIPQVQRHRLLPSILLVDIADAVGCQVDLPILLVGELELPIRRLRVSHSVVICNSAMPPCQQPWGARAHDTDPSYSPTLSWTKRRSSSGRYEGRSAVVKSICFRNIRHKLGKAVPLALGVFAFCEKPQRLLEELQNDKAG